MLISIGQCRIVAVHDTTLLRKLPRIRPNYPHHNIWQAFVAMLYHELLLSDIDQWRLSLENNPDIKDERYKDKKIDLWVEAPGDKLTYMIEVKLISYREKSKGLRHMNSMNGVKGDLNKLSGIIKNQSSIKGIVVGAYTGESNVRLQQIKNEVKKDTKTYLSNKIKLIVSTPKECDFV